MKIADKTCWGFKEIASRVILLMTRDFKNGES